MTAKKYTKKRDARAEVLFSTNLTYCFLPFSLTSLSFLLKLPIGGKILSDRWDIAGFIFQIAPYKESVSSFESNRNGEIFFFVSDWLKSPTYIPTFFITS